MKINLQFKENLNSGAYIIQIVSKLESHFWSQVAVFLTVYLLCKRIVPNLKRRRNVMIYINTWLLSWRKFILIRLSVHPGDFAVSFVCSFNYITCVNIFFVLSLDLRRKRMRSPENGIREEKISPSFITGKFSTLSVYIKLLKNVFTCF